MSTRRAPTQRPKAVVLVAAALIVAGAVFLLLRDPNPLPPTGIDRRAIETYEVGGLLRSVAVTPDAVWVGRGDRSILKLDPDTGEVLERATLAFMPGDMLAAGGALWVGAIEGERIARVDEDTARLDDDIRIGTTPQALAADADYLYVAAFDDGLIRRLELATGRPEGSLLEDKEAFPSSLAIGFGGLWVSDVVQDSVTRLPAPTGKREVVPVGDSPTRVVTGEGGVWVANFNERSITRIDPDTAEPGPPILVGGKPGAIATGAGYVWVLRPGSDSFVLVDAEAERWTGDVFDVASSPEDIAVGVGSAWIVSQDGTLTRVATDR